MKPLLRFENINYSYEKDRKALNNVSVVLNSSEKVVILGNNGAGKSTFFMCCNGVLVPQSGKIYLEGQVISSGKKDRFLLHQTTGLVFQDPDHQIIAGTVEAEVSFGPMNLKLPLEAVKNSVDSALAGMGLEGFRRRAPHYLSGGEKKRVSIADVLAMHPKVLLLDEPFSGLDPENSENLEKKMENLSREGFGIVVATHDIDFAWRFADRIIIFDDGELIADGDVETIFSDEELLTRCKLPQPILYQIGKKFNLDPLPKKADEIP